MEAGDEIELGPRDSQDRHFLSVMAWEGISDDVVVAGLVLHYEVESGQFAHPVVLGMVDKH